MTIWTCFRALGGRRPNWHDSRVATAAELGELTAFFEPRLAKLEGAQRGYDEGVAEAKRCIATKERERKNSATLFAR